MIGTRPNSITASSALSSGSLHHAHTLITAPLSLQLGTQSKNRAQAGVAGQADGPHRLDISQLHGTKAHVCVQHFQMVNISKFCGHADCGSSNLSSSELGGSPTSARTSSSL